MFTRTRHFVGIITFFLCLALNHQRKYRSAGCEFISCVFCREICIPFVSTYVFVDLAIPTPKNVRARNSNLATANRPTTSTTSSSSLLLRSTKSSPRFSWLREVRRPQKRVNMLSNLFWFCYVIFRMSDYVNCYACLFYSSMNYLSALMKCNDFLLRTFYFRSELHFFVCDLSLI